MIARGRLTDVKAPPSAPSRVSSTVPASAMRRDRRPRADRIRGDARHRHGRRHGAVWNTDMIVVVTDAVSGLPRDVRVPTGAPAIVRRLVPEEVDEPGLLAGAVPFTERQVKLLESLRDAAESYSSLAEIGRAHV